MALVFWKDSLDFNRIIKKQMDYVEPRSTVVVSATGAPGVSSSPERSRTMTYKRAAEEAIQQMRAGQGSRSIVANTAMPLGFGQGGANTIGGGGFSRATNDFNNSYKGNAFPRGW